MKPFLVLALVLGFLGMGCGKKGDLRAPELEPCYDVISHLVYAAGRENVSHVWVAGELLMQERELLNPTLRALHSRGQVWQNALKKHADS